MRVKGQKRRLAVMGVATVFAVLGHGGQAVASGDPYYERSFILAAHERCGLFTPELAAALTVSAHQARGAALRRGTSVAELDRTVGRARNRARSTPCDHADLRLVAGRVERAFDGWRSLPRLEFPGLQRPWQADRRVQDRSGWALSQETRMGAAPVIFGVGHDRRGPMQAVVAFPGRSRPYAARVVMRDGTREAHPWLSDRMPPETVRLTVWATGQAPAQPGRLPPGRSAGEAWSFPASLADRLERLDPRESFWIEFLFRDGSVARASFEVGDIAAGRAFLAMGAL